MVINPELTLGKPVIEGTGIETWVVARQYSANKKNAALVADLFDINELQVEKAVQFERKYGTSLAA